MSIISKPYTFTAGATIIAAEHNANFDTLYNDYNGNITNANFSSSAALSDTKLSQISTAGKVSGSALTSLASTPFVAGGFPWANMPPGMPLAYPSTAAPTGCIALDGSAVSRTVYAILFSLYSTTYGIGDGSTTFNLPDMRGRVIGGYKSGDSNFGTIGGTGGEATHILTTPEMPAHTHTFTGRNSNGDGAVMQVSDTQNQSHTVTSDSTGGGGAHNNLQPYMTWLWITSTGGI